LTAYTYYSRSSPLPRHATSVYGRPLNKLVPLVSLKIYRICTKRRSFETRGGHPGLVNPVCGQQLAPTDQVNGNHLSDWCHQVSGYGLHY